MYPDLERGIPQCCKTTVIFVVYLSVITAGVGVASTSRRLHRSQLPEVPGVTATVTHLRIPWISGACRWRLWSPHCCSRQRGCAPSLHFSRVPWFFYSSLEQLHLLHRLLLEPRTSWTPIQLWCGCRRILAKVTRKLARGMVSIPAAIRCFFLRRTTMRCVERHCGIWLTMACRTSVCSNVDKQPTPFNFQPAYTREAWSQVSEQKLI